MTRSNDLNQLLQGLPRGLHHRADADHWSILRETIEWSWSLLGPLEQLALSQLSVFHGGFTLEAAEQVLDLSDDENEHWVGVVLQRLRDTSLVRDPNHPSLRGEQRYELSESVREIAGWKLDQRSERVETEARHAAYYLWVCGEWAEAIQTRGDAISHDRLSLEIENVMAIYRRILDRDPLDDEMIEQAFLAFLAVAPVLARRGLVGVYFQWVEQALDLAATMAVRPELLARLSHLRATMLCRYGRFGFAVGYLEGALELARSVGDTWVEASSLLHLGLSWAARKDGAQSLRCLEQAREPAQKVNAPMLQCELEKVTGLALHMLGETERAVERFEQAVSIARDHDFTWELVVNLHNQGDALTRLGRYERALSALRQSRELAKNKGYQGLEEINDVLIGCVEAVWTKRPESLAKVESALEAARSIGNSWVVVQASYFLGVALAGLGESVRAHELLTESLEIARADGNRAFVEDCQRALARL